MTYLHTHFHTNSVSSIPVSVLSLTSNPSVLLSRCRTKRQPHNHNDQQQHHHHQNQDILLTTTKITTKITTTRSIYMDTLAVVQYDLLLQQDARRNGHPVRKNYKLISKLQATCIRIAGGGSGGYNNHNHNIQLAISSHHIITTNPALSTFRQIPISGGTWKLAIHEFSTVTQEVMRDFLFLGNSSETETGFKYGLVLYKFPPKNKEKVEKVEPRSEAIIGENNRTNSLNMASKLLRKPSRMSRFFRRNSHGNSMIPKPVEEEKEEEEDIKEEFFVVVFTSFNERQFWIDTLLPLLSLDHVTNTDSELDKRLEMVRNQDVKNKVTEWVTKNEVYRKELEKDHNDENDDTVDNCKEFYNEHDTSVSFTSIKELKDTEINLNPSFRKQALRSPLRQNGRPTTTHLYNSHSYNYNYNPHSHSQQMSMESNYTTGTHFTTGTAGTSLPTSPVEVYHKAHLKRDSFSSTEDEVVNYGKIVLTGMHQPPSLVRTRQAPLRPGNLAQIPSVQSLIQDQTPEMQDMMEIVYSGSSNKGLGLWNNLHGPVHGPPRVALPALPGNYD